MTSTLQFSLCGLIIIAFLSSACSDTTNDTTETGLSDSTYLVTETPGGKNDTGYASNVATEFQAVFRSTISFSLKNVEPELWQSVASALMSPGSPELLDGAGLQLKFGKTEFNSKGLRPNHLVEAVQALEVTVDPETTSVRVLFQAETEVIVAHSDALKHHWTAENLIGKRFTATVPDNPWPMHFVAKMACQDEESHGPDPLSYYYYFDAFREGCAEAMLAGGIERVGLEIEIVSVEPPFVSFPEYDRLMEDGRLDIIAFFPHATDGWVPGSFDWGASARDKFVRNLRQAGFGLQSTPKGDIYERVKSGVVQSIRVVGPELLQSLPDFAKSLYRELIPNYEIVLYNGHSNYGSLDILTEPTLYPGHYQIFFINACWSYEYYTKQIFQHNKTEQDPMGWANADVVINTELGWFDHFGSLSTILVANLLRGSMTGGVEGHRFYSWDRIVTALNSFAQANPNDGQHELFGVSGVKGNSYTP